MKNTSRIDAMLLTVIYSWARVNEWEIITYTNHATIYGHYHKYAPRKIMDDEPV